MSPIHGGPSEKIETLTYAPGLQGGTDLEAATKTISHTSENAVADYTSVHTIAAPTDARIAVLRGCMRLTVTIDSWAGGGVQLNYRVKRGGASVSTGVLAVAAATGQKIISWDITTLITGAQTNTLFLWVDAGTCVISEVTMWTGVGSCIGYLGVNCLSLTHVGKAQFRGLMSRVGTGNLYLAIAATSAFSSATCFAQSTAVATGYELSSLALWQGIHQIASAAYVSLCGAVATDLIYIANIGFLITTTQ